MFSLSLALCIACDASAPTDATDVDSDTASESDSETQGPTLDERITTALADELVPVVALDAPTAQDPALVALGEALFFDPILSGNKDVACATCHQVDNGTGDGLALNLGTGAVGLGPERAQEPHPPWGKRHTPDLWNRGLLDRQFWDARVERTDAGVTAPAPIPEGLHDALAVQALHPLLDAGEMRGSPGDKAIDGAANELAGLPDTAAYDAIAARVRGIDGYASLWSAAFADAPVDIAGIARALAAFQRERFAASDTPWDLYLRGDTEALDVSAKLGAAIFYGQARCSVCHAGALMTDQKTHNIGVPLLSVPDEGRAGVSDLTADRFAFRTPPLRNAAASPPFMHNGTLPDLQRVVVHYGDPEATAPGFTGEALPTDLTDRIVNDGTIVDDMVDSLSADLPLQGSGASLAGLSNVRAFLLALVDEAAIERAKQVPDSVPSGLRVGGGG